MKNLPLVCLILISLLSEKSYARKSPIVNIEIANEMADLYIKNKSLLHFKFTREDGTVDYTRGYSEGKINWNKLYIKTKQGNVYNSMVYVDHEALQKNNYILDLEVYIGQGRLSFIKNIQYVLPRITSIEIAQDSIVPYTWYNYNVVVKTTATSYALNNINKLGVFHSKDFSWMLDSRFEKNERMYRYVPQEESTAKTLRILVKNEKLGLQDVRDVPLQVVRYKNFTYKAKSGQNGKNGENGESGYTGEQGGNGGGGWHGADGDEGKHTELIVTRHTPEQLKIALFIDEKREIYYVPVNTQISITVPGGNGGDGGKGGNGGDGGGSSDEYEAGDDGAGGPGGNGGNGGLGGYVQVFSDLEISILSQILSISTPGGEPGIGGRGGSGSPSGTGGKLGKRGKTGSVAYQIISKEDIAQMMKELGL